MANGVDCKDNILRVTFCGNFVLFIVVAYVLYLIFAAQEDLFPAMSQYNGHPGFENLTRAFRNKLFSLPRKLLTHTTLSEKNWCVSFQCYNRMASAQENREFGYQFFQTGRTQGF